MPLSEHEQRVFDEIEQSLADDPHFASAVRAHDPARFARRRMILAGLIALIGLGMLIGGVMVSRWVGVAGAVVMFAGAIYAMRVQHKAATGELRAVGGTASRRTGGRSSRRRSSFGDRLEERWRRRRDSGDTF